MKATPKKTTFNRRSCNSAPAGAVLAERLL
nr:MAG TPA: hypothetical protein [Caudoviricetes sp.]